MVTTPAKSATSRDPWVPYVPSPTTPWNLARVVHLHRRAGFAATWVEIQRDLRDGPQASVTRVLAGKARLDGTIGDFESVSQALAESAASTSMADRLKAWWVFRMLFSPDPLGERLTLMWHNHFATSNLKVNDLAAMVRQNQIFREFARAPFGELLRARSRIRPCSIGSTRRPIARSMPTKTWPANRWSCSRSAWAIFPKPT